LSITHPLGFKDKLIIDSKIRSHFIIGNHFQSYQAAQIGGDNGLRGFRRERFTGKNSFTQNTNLRFTIDQVNTAILPMTYGISLGYDYGRVWLPTEDSDTWHTSYGTTLWMSFVGATKANFSLFNSTDGLQFTFGVGLSI
ncbi:phosphoesterase, partial [Flavobacteriaceae bacterium]|nr:phosphoesterase [Flavobacteriaceae bacterium]